MTEVGVRYRTAKVRAVEDEAEGIVEALVSAYGVAYRIGWWGEKEIIEPGAFDASIAEKPFAPVYVQHLWGLGPIGDGEWSTSDAGLKMRAQLYVDQERGQAQYRAIKSGALDEWSIAYLPTTIKLDEDDEDLEHVLEAKVFEASSVLIGANPNTETISVRTRDGGTKLLAPETIVDPTGTVTIRWRTVEKPDKPEPPAPTTTAATPAEAYALLSRPGYRDAIRKQLSSDPVPSS